MTPNDHQVEEYKQIGAAIIESEKYILQIFGGTIAVAVPLLSAVAGLILGKDGSQVSIILAYVALASNLLVIPSFYLLLSQRLALMRMGSYSRVFFEEQNGIRGWETRLEKFRNEKDTESNDPIPYTFWAIFSTSAGLFSYGIYKSDASLHHLFVLGILITFLALCHYKWKCVIRKRLPEYIEQWRQLERDPSEEVGLMNIDQHNSKPIPVNVINNKSYLDKVVTILAFLVSLAALGVTGVFSYRAYRHGEMSVEPNVSLWQEPDQSEPKRLPVRRWKVFNGGLGPAIIQEMVLFVNDQPGQGPISKDDHWKVLSSLRGVKHTINWGKLLVPGESFQAGAEIEPFSLRWNDVRTMEAVDIETLPVLAICYCSFYEKCTYKDSRPYSDNPTKPLMNCPETQKNPSQPPRKGLRN